MAKMNGKDGHWYTDQNGNHYFVGEGESPKEGWEKTKRRKMIDGGKYKVDDGDGKGSREVSMEEYDKYEAEDGDFDMTTDDDFGFDTDDRPTPEQDLENEEIWDADYERSYGPYNFDAWDDVEMLKKAYGKAKEAGMDDSAQNALERIEELGGEFDPDESDGTNGWKPSDEATPAYDAGGFYSINEGDKWELDDGGSVEVRGVDGENVEVMTPNGTKRMTKDRLSDIVKNATKITADANKGSKNENLQNVLSKAGIKTSMDPVVDGENVRLFAYTDSQARRWKEKLEKLGYNVKSSYDQGAYLVNFSLNDSTDNQGSKSEAPKPKKTDEQKKADMKAKAKAKRDKEIQSMGKEIVEYYNGDPIDEDEVADILGGEYGYGQRMVNAIIKWVKENQ